MKKIISFTIIISLVLWCFSFNTSNDVIASVQGTQYYFFDCSTRNRIGIYTLPPLNDFNNSSNQPRNVYPPDNRELDYTNSGMVKVISESFNGDALSGSAFVIGDHLIATAAHCVVSNSNSNRCKYISDLLLFDSNGNISLNATPVEVHVEKNYFVQDNTSNDTDIFANDYAVIVVEEDLSSYTHLQLTTTTNNFYNSYENIYLTGFPHEITDNSNNSSITVNNSTSLHNEYTSVTNHIINMDSKYLYYRNDNSAGNSGGPVYLKENYNDMEYYSVVAINVSDTTGINLGDEIFPMNANEGVRITTKLLRFYYNNDNLSFWY